MGRVLLVSYDPETVDYSDPALPPGMNVEKIRGGIALALKQMTDRRWDADLCLVRPDETAGPIRASTGFQKLRLCRNRRGRPPASSEPSAVRGVLVNAIHQTRTLLRQSLEVALISAT